MSLINLLLRRWQTNSFSLEVRRFFDIRDDSTIEAVLDAELKNVVKGNAYEGRQSNLMNSLAKYGLVEHYQVTDHGRSHPYTKKMGRFIFWVEYNNKVGKVPSCVKEEFHQEPETIVSPN